MVKLKKQKVRLRKKKVISSFSKKPDIDIKKTFKFLLAVFIVTSIGLGFVKLKYMLTDSGSFVIKGIEVRLHDEYDTVRNVPIDDISKDVVGTNIFFTDLNALKEKIESAHPEFKDVLIRRLLPNKLIVNAVERKRVAQIQSDRYYFVDEEGVLLPDVKNFPEEDFPIITGLGINLAKLTSSKFSDFERENLNKTLGLLREIKSNERLSQYKVRIIDITDPGNVSFLFESFNVEIKIGNTDFSNRLLILSTLLDQIESDISSFKYIDLRFEDPILGPR